MARLVLIALLFATSCGSIDDLKSNFNNKKEEIKSQNTITITDALESLALADRTNSSAYEISKQSVAQVVFPKIVKAGFLIGANYGEGFLIRNGEVVALIDLTGGNLGLQVGGQTYSQVTYILSENRYREFLNTNRMSLNGSISMAVTSGPYHRGACWTSGAGCPRAWCRKRCGASESAKSTPRSTCVTPCAPSSTTTASW